MPKPTKNKRTKNPLQAESYQHTEAKSLLRPEVGTQAQFKKKKPPKTYRYDSSLSPALDWDSQNPAREQGEVLIKQLLDAKNLEEAKDTAVKLKAFSKPFLNWAGKAERLSFDVPTLKKTLPLGVSGLPGISDYLLWYCKPIEQIKYRQLFIDKPVGEGTGYTWVELPRRSSRAPAHGKISRRH